jgi:hypothetical protein
MQHENIEIEILVSLDIIGEDASISTNAKMHFMK